MDAVPDIVDAVLIFLALLSLLIWTVGIAKFVAFYRNAGDDRQFLQAFAKATHVQELLGVMQSAKGRLARVCQFRSLLMTNAKCCCMRSSCNRISNRPG